ncbi:MAG: hypothetical protein ABIP89_15890 [Polyangiaceae bacterium]
MYTYLLQDWTSLASPSTILTAKQTQDNWLSFSGFQDVVAWIQISDFTASANITLKLETSPSEDEAFFATMKQQTITSTGVFALIVPAALAVQPLTNWVRWTVVAGNAVAWGLSFRVVLSLNAIERGFQAVRGQTAVAPLLGA